MVNTTLERSQPCKVVLSKNELLKTFSVTEKTPCYVHVYICFHKKKWDFENQSPVDPLCLAFLVCGLTSEAEWAWKLDIKIVKFSETAKSCLTLEKIFTPGMLKFGHNLDAFACQTASNRAKRLKLNFLKDFEIWKCPSFLLSLQSIWPKYLSSCHDIIMKIHTDGHR